MVLIALYRLGGSAEQMTRYTKRFDLDGTPEPPQVVQTGTVTLENWQLLLGQGRFPQYVEFFQR